MGGGTSNTTVQRRQTELAAWIDKVLNAVASVAVGHGRVEPPVLTDFLTPAGVL